MVDIILMKNKINKNEFIKMVAEENGLKVKDVKFVYEAIVDKIRDVICDDQDLSLTGFGTFSLQKHKGHPIQFRSDSDKVDDYAVLKFAVSDALMTKIRKNYKVK